MVAAGQVFKGITSREGMSFMPGRHVNDHQMRLYMKLRHTHAVPIDAAKASISTATAYRIEGDHRLPSQKHAQRARVGPDPLDRTIAGDVGTRPPPDTGSAESGGHAGRQVVHLAA